MRKSLKAFLFFILPVTAVLFFQAEKNHLKAAQHKSAMMNDQSDVSSDYDDDSISFPAINDDGDDSSESIVRLLPAISTSISLEFFHPYKADASLSVSFKGSHKEISQSFLKVFRI
ncbi:MAG TPA: hypothetical protein VFJ43_02260 [Bacteroidia bacterium]|nr:hypothetical protein [Bacteroidia bacterium]